MEIFRIGLGCMPFSTSPGLERGLHRETVAAALDAGVNLLDTADAYAPGADMGFNERQVAAALRGRSREGLVVATKGGHTRPAGGWEIDGSPQYLRAACEASLRALETDCIDLYQLHRPDPTVPWAESIGALRDLRDEGKVRHVGLSNVTVAQLEEAEAIVPIAAVQNELSLDYTDPLAKGEVEACAQRGIAYLAWSPLGGIGASDAPARHQAVREAAERHGASPQQVALAWLLSLSEAVTPIPGASRPATILDSVAAAELRLDAPEIEKIARESATLRTGQ